MPSTGPAAAPARKQGRVLTALVRDKNLGKFVATPPTLLLHLVKQNVVKRNPQLKKLLIAHRNMPSEGKRL